MNTVTARPQTVTISVAMLSALVLYGLASSIFLAINGNIARLIPQGIVTPNIVIYVTLCIAIFSLAFNSFFIYEIFKGKNWARIVYLALFVLGAVFSINGYMRLFFHPAALGYPIVMGYVGIVGFLIRLAAVMLLFSGSSNLWFKRLQA